MWNKSDGWLGGLKFDKISRLIWSFSHERNKEKKRRKGKRKENPKKTRERSKKTQVKPMQNSEKNPLKHHKKIVTCGYSIMPAQ